jgi:hypothetical protein
MSQFPRHRFYDVPDYLHYEGVMMSEALLEKDKKEREKSESQSSFQSENW